MKLSEIFIIQMRILNLGCNSERPDLVFLISIKPSKHCNVLYQFCHPNMSLSFQDSSVRFRWCALVSSSLVIEVCVPCSTVAICASLYSVVSVYAKCKISLRYLSILLKILSISTIISKQVMIINIENKQSMLTKTIINRKSLK